MSTRVIVLGDGTGGLISANLLAKTARRRGVPLDIKLIGRSSPHTYQPGLLFLPFQKPGYRTLGDIQRDNRAFIGKGVEYVCDEITELDTESRSVVTRHGRHDYDWLVISLGCRTVLEDIPGLAEHWAKRCTGSTRPKAPHS